VSNEEAKPLEAAGVSQLLEAYESGETNSEQVVSDLFTRIENDALNIFISTPERDALLEQARAQDARRAAGDALGALAGFGPAAQRLRQLADYIVQRRF